MSHVVAVVALIALVALIAMGAATARRGAPGRRPEGHWVAGIFYRDRADRRIFVPKRRGFGWTLNFGHRVAWVIVLVPVVVAVVSRAAGHR